MRRNPSEEDTETKDPKLPLYKQIYKTLRDEIINGKYDQAGMLPSEKALGQRFSVERNTVRKALQILVTDGAIVKIPGYGTRLSTAVPVSAGEQQNETTATRNCILVITHEDYLRSTDGEFFHLKLIRNLERMFSNLGFTLLIKAIETPEDLANTVLNTSPTAIVFDSYNQNATYQQAVLSGLPCISINHYTPLMTSIVSNNFDGAYQVMKMLTNAGHSKIAVITGKQNYQTNIERLSGVRRLYLHRKAALDEQYLFSGNWRFQSGVEAGEAIAAMPESKRPTAVFAFNDDMAFGCMSWFEKHGIRIPDDISIVGFDNTERYQAIFRPITTVDVSIHALVEYACWYLTGRMSNMAPGTCAKIHINTAIVDNGTVKQLRPAIHHQEEIRI